MGPRARWIAALAAGLLLASLAVTVALGQAGNPRQKIRGADVVAVAAGETVDGDVYLFGRQATIAGTVHGDVIVAASELIMTGTVDGDLLGAAATVSIGGRVGGDVRLAAADVTIPGQIGEDLALVGGDILLTNSGSVGEDLFFGGTNVTLDGNVGGGILGSATRYVRRGSVGGTEEVTLPPVEEETASSRTADLALSAIRQFVVVMLFGLLGLWLVPRGFRAASGIVRARLVQSLGFGLLAFIGAIVAVFLILVLAFLLGAVFGRFSFDGLAVVGIIGGMLASAGIAFGLVVFVAFIGDAIVGFALGRLISAPEANRLAELLRLAVGAAIVVIVTSFPEIGGIAKLLVVLAALGAATIAINEARRRPPTAPAALPGYSGYPPPPPDTPSSI